MLLPIVCRRPSCGTACQEHASKTSEWSDYYLRTYQLVWLNLTTFSCVRVLVSALSWIQKCRRVFMDVRWRASSPEHPFPLAAVNSGTLLIPRLISTHNNDFASGAKCPTKPWPAPTMQCFAFRHRECITEVVSMPGLTMSITCNFDSLPIDDCNWKCLTS